MELLALEFACFAYLTAAAAYMTGIAYPSDWTRRLGPWALGTAFVLQSLSVVLHVIDTGVIPVEGFTEGLAFFAWLLVATYVFVQRKQEVSVLAAAIAPMAFLFTLLAIEFYSERTVLPESWQTPWLTVHVTLAFLGNAVFGLAFVVSLVYLVQERLLKSHRRAWMIRRLPALETMDRLGYLFLFWGFPLLSLGMVSGGVWALSMLGKFWTWEPREILSVITWVLYAGLLEFRLVGGLRGKRAAYLTILGFMVLVVSYIAVTLISVPGARHGGVYTS